MLFTFTSFIWLSTSLNLVYSVRVCPSFYDYDWIFNDNCYDNPVVNQNITEIIQSWGYTAEEHYLQTEDGYQILLERSHAKITKGTPIIIVHGIAMNSLGFVIRGNGSLAYLLGSLGYDVWLLNYRGTWYSKGHSYLSTKDRKYWSYSINELGIYDVRTAIKYVCEKTRKKPIYIGYSMGTTGFFIYSSTFPDEAKSYIRGMIGLAPVINYKGIRSITTLSTLPVVWPTIKSTVYELWHGEILPGFSVFLRPLVKFSLGMYLIQTGINLVFGANYDQMDAINYPPDALYIIDTAGIEVYGHYVQIYLAGVFQNYDYGYANNLKIYGQPNPPPYNLSKISVPVSIFVGQNDGVATPTNANQLYSELQPTSRCGYHLIEDPKWNHIDFLMGKDLYKYLYEPLFKKIEDIERGKCQT